MSPSFTSRRVDNKIIDNLESVGQTHPKGGERYQKDEGSRILRSKIGTEGNLMSQES